MAKRTLEQKAMAIAEVELGTTESIIQKELFDFISNKSDAELLAMVSHVGRAKSIVHLAMIRDYMVKNCPQIASRIENHKVALAREG